MGTILKDRVCKEVAIDFNELVDEQNHTVEEAAEFVIEEFLTELEDFTEEEERAEKSLVYASLFNELNNRGMNVSSVNEQLKELIIQGADLDFWTDQKDMYEARKKEWNEILNKL